MVILLIVELDLHLGYSFIMSSDLILELDDLILVDFHVVCLFCLYLIDHLEEFFLFFLQVVNLDFVVIDLCCQLAFSLLVSVDYGLQLSNSDFVEVLNFLQFDKVFICLIELDLILLF